MKYPFELESDENGERWRLAGNEIISHVHLRYNCQGTVCPLHNPSDHHMRSFKMHYRHDRGIFERICKHGVGHIDPDDYRTTVGLDKGLHGCDGCCWKGSV